MTNLRKHLAGSITAMALVGASPLTAQGLTSLASTPAAPSTTAVAPEITGWNEFIGTLQRLPGRILAKLPPEWQADPQIRQEAVRRTLEALTSGGLDVLSGDGDHPAFVASLGQALNVGQPNADTIYRTAHLTAGGSYRMRGRRGSLRIVKIGQSGPSPFEPGWKRESGYRSYLDLNALKVDAHGNYDVLISPSRPQGYTGDWWQLQPNTTKLLLRMVSSDWGKEIDPTFSLERVDANVAQARPTAAQLEARLDMLARRTAFMALLDSDRVANLRRDGYVNRLKSFGPDDVAGLLAGQYYYEGAFEMMADEAIVVEVRAPAKCTYSSLLLTNDLYETLNWTDNQGSLNDSQAVVDKDGILRIVIAPKDPGVANWLDTGGHLTGLVQGRWTDCDTHPTPALRKVSVTELKAALPRGTAMVTPAQRDRIIRERRAAFQKRPLW